MSRRGRRRKARGINERLLVNLGLTQEQYGELTTIPVSEREQNQEMKLAYLQGRQPYCVHCRKPLQQVQQTQSIDLYWQ